MKNWKELLKEESKKEVTNVDLFNKTVECMKTHCPEIKEAMEALDYSLASNYEPTVILTEEHQEGELMAIVNPGGSEGVYIDCSLKFKNADRCWEYVKLGTFKTLDEGMEAHVNMGMLAGAFTYLAERYLWFNIEA